MAKGATAVKVAVADSVRDLARQRRRRDDPEPRIARGNPAVAPPAFAGQPQNWSANALGLPREDPCPVEPLGIEGEFYHLIDSSGQFRSLTASDFSHAGIQSLFAAMPNWPQWAWPRFGKVTNDSTTGQPLPAPIKSFDDDAVRSALFLACTRRGLFSPTDKLRGRGMWATKGGGLIYHAGEELWLFDGARIKAIETGLHEGYFYPRLPSLPAPWTEQIALEEHPARELLTGLTTFSWTRREIDPILLLGWLAVAYLGAALDWRTAILLLGGFGTGKSTLQDGLKALFGEALFHSADATAAGIYQKMAHDSRPIAIDELEPDADSRKVDNVVNLMRASASGAIGRRGSAGGTAGEFQMRSAFLFSAINNPLHASQDLSRVAILRLNELDKKAGPPPVIDPDSCGRMVLALLMREWPRFLRTRELYMAALGRGGHSQRGQKNYGTLLAAADCLLGAELAEELGISTAFTVEGLENTAGLDFWSKALAADALPEVEDALPNWKKCLDYILTSHVEAWRHGKRQTVGQLLQDVQTPSAVNIPTVMGIEEAQSELGLTGLGLKAPGSLPADLADPQSLVLAIPNDHPAIARLLRETEWARGGWKDALRQCPAQLQVMVTDKRHNKVKIAGVDKRCTLVVLKRYYEAPER